MRHLKQIRKFPKLCRLDQLSPQGDTMVEVLIALAVIISVLLGAYGLSQQSTRTVRTSQEFQEATSIGNSQVERIVANQGLAGDDNECYDSSGNPAKNEIDGKCDFDNNGVSGCTKSDRGYCYNVFITRIVNTLNGYSTTTYKVAVTWDNIHGDTGTAFVFYRLPIWSLANANPSPPGPPPSPTGVIMAQIDVGNYHVCANSQAGGGYCWGKNDFGALGNGTNNNSNAPFEVNNTGVLAGKTIVGTSAGYNHTCVLDSNGLVYCWGYNSQGQLGNGASGTTNNPFPTAVVTTGAMSGERVSRINGGDSHTCALTDDGEVYCWGGNNYGQLGTGDTFSSFVPKKITNSGPISGKVLMDISSGYAHTCALATDGVAYCWGFNGHGQLGNGNNNDSSTPVAVAGGLRFSQISAGDEHTCGVTNSGTLYCWGYNEQGQLGDNTMVDTNSPKAVVTSGVLGGKTISKVAAGYRHTCAIGNGDVFCWGNNDAGQLGNGETAVRRLAPVAVINTGVMAGDTIADIATGRYSTCAVGSIVNGGKVYCWGKNDDGQLGDGNQPNDSNVPSLVTFP